MSGLAKTFVILILFLSALFFGTTAALFQTRRNSRDEYEKYSKQTTEELSRLDAALKSATRENDKKDDTIGQLESRGEQLSLGFEKSRSDNTALKSAASSSESARKTAEALSEQLGANLQATQDRVNKLEEELDQSKGQLNTSLEDADLARKERDAMRLSLVRANEALHEARAEYQKLSETHEGLALTLEAIRRKHPGMLEGAPLPAPPIDALIHAVDSDEQLALISAGRDQEVEVGYRFTVARGNSYIGTLEVIKVYPDLAGARIVLTKEGEQVRQGDKVFTSVD
jgi:vacuolar-type H+-ATPase subunit I/STV1